MSVSAIVTHKEVPSGVCEEESTNRDQLEGFRISPSATTTVTSTPRSLRAESPSAFSVQSRPMRARQADVYKEVFENQQRVKYARMIGWSIEEGVYRQKTFLKVLEADVRDNDILRRLSFKASKMANHTLTKFYLFFSERKLDDLIELYLIKASLDMVESAIKDVFIQADMDGSRDVIVKGAKDAFLQAEYSSQLFKKWLMPQPASFLPIQDEEKQ